MRLSLNILITTMTILAAITGASNGVARSLTVSAPDWPPFYIHETNDEASRGMAWDLLRSCADHLTPRRVLRCTRSDACSNIWSKVSST